MEELFNELMAIFTEKVSDLAENLDIDEIMQGVTDAVHSTVDALSGADVNLDEDTKQSIISNIIGSLDGEDTSAILENLNIITKNPLDGIDTGSEIASQGINFTDTATSPSANGTQISFTSIGCWDECFATTKDHGKRLTCGYQY